jgi:acetyl-CoA carboxylase alpha subunit
MGGMNTDSTGSVTAADRDAFIELWKKAFTAGAFSDDQAKRLAVEIEEASKKLAENYKVLSGYLEKLKKAKDEKIEKRLNITEAERDLIISQVKLKLKEFLNNDQVIIVEIAVFHGTSMSLAGDDHLNSMHGGIGEQLGNVKQLAMDLGKLSGKLNQECQAVTLELVRTTFEVTQKPEKMEM